MLPWQAEQQIFTPTRIAVHTPSSPAPFAVIPPFIFSLFPHLPFPTLFSSFLSFPTFSFWFLSPSLYSHTLPPSPVIPSREAAASVGGGEKGSGRSRHRSSIQAFTPQFLQVTACLQKDPIPSLWSFSWLCCSLFIAHLNSTCMLNICGHTLDTSRQTENVLFSHSSSYFDDICL